MFERRGRPAARSGGRGSPAARAPGVPRRAASPGSPAAAGPRRRLEQEGEAAVRRFSDEVHVRCGVRGGPPGAPEQAPVQFVWRGRLYLVRAVLGRWRERSAWWEQPAVAALHGEEPGGEASVSSRPLLALGDLEREVFRVEAAVGRAPVGVYDLAHPVPAGTAARERAVVSEAAGTQDGDGAWQLLRVSD
ncbi:DUF6504 family protein [Kineococcus auxinigenes]|uniref:DUF6504 family protein n=1 Tax=unclassified Kineococcus TaxID=2621656 RepID=UPI003D7D3176